MDMDKPQKRTIGDNLCMLLFSTGIPDSSYCRVDRQTLRGRLPELAFAHPPR